jgi:hypothetical protein
MRVFYIYLVILWTFTFIILGYLSYVDYSVVGVWRVYSSLIALGAYLISFGVWLIMFNRAMKKLGL